MPPEIRMQSVSPSGLFEITVSMREIFNSHWLEVPTLIERASGSILWTVADDRWSLDETAWDGGAVTMTLRKYPGNHEPREVKARIDCVARMAQLGGKAVPLAALEQALDATLSWQFCPRPERVPVRSDNWRARLRRFFLGE
jgi:hypothetical protein